MKKLIVSSATYVAATIIAFSQTPEQKPSQGLTLPANNVELVSPDGRKITVNVLSKNYTGIITSNENNTRNFVKWSQLSDETIKKITGDAGIPLSPQMEQLKKMKERQQEREAEALKLEAAGKEAIEFEKKARVMPALELHQLIIKNDPSIYAIVELSKDRWKREEKFQSGKDPDWRKYNFWYLDVAGKMEVKPNDVEEVVSLRPEFEKLGVKAHEQEKNLCTMYSVQHAAQYIFMSQKMAPPSIQEMKARVLPMWDWNQHGGSTPNYILIKALNQFAGKRLKVMWLDAPAEQLHIEMIKHELRKGHPCVVTTNETIGDRGGAHQVVVVGFRAKDGKTTWEVINSNNVANDGGYTTKDYVAGKRQDMTDAFSAWFE